MAGRTAPGRGVIGAAFELLAHIGRLEPVRLVDLAAASGLPRPTVYRLLQQLIEVGAVHRDGTLYRSGFALLGLSEQVSPERRLRTVARRPMAELAARTGAAVFLSAPMGQDVVLLDAIDARLSLGRPIPPMGTAVPAGTAMAEVHGLGSDQPAGRLPDLAVDLGRLDPSLSCACAAVPLPGGSRAALTLVFASGRLPHTALQVLRATAAQVALACREQAKGGDGESAE